MTVIDDLNASMTTAERSRPIERQVRERVASERTLFERETHIRGLMWGIGAGLDDFLESMGLRRRGTRAGVYASRMYVQPAPEGLARPAGAPHNAVAQPIEWRAAPTGVTSLLTVASAPGGCFCHLIDADVTLQILHRNNTDRWGTVPLPEDASVVVTCGRANCVNAQS